METLNYHHLLYFWTAARSGGVTAAAERLMVSQPTVSGQIRLLEKSIGRDLFERRGRELVLTETGRVVYAYAERIFTAGEELQEALRGDDLTGPRTFRVGVADALPKLVSCVLLEGALHAGSQPIHMICHEGRSERLLSEMSVRGLDLVLTETPPPSSAHVRAYAHPLGECGMSFFGAPELAASMSGGFPGSLDGAPMLLPTANATVRRSLDQWFERHGLRPRIVAEFDDNALLKVFGQRGAGVFPAPALVESDVVRQYQVRLIDRVEDVRMQFFAITLDRTLKDPVAAAVCDGARSALSAIGDRV